MNSHPELKLDWCSYKAAKYAVEHYHYSKRMPRSKMNTVGVWENGKYIGTVVFSYGATPQIGSPYSLNQYEICELTRVALRKHENPTSRIVAIAIRMLIRHCPNLRLIVSFADSEQDHIGIIYQAMNWIYAGETKIGRVGFVVRGQKVHTRTIGSKRGGIQSLQWVRENLDPEAQIWQGKKKYRYLYPFDSEMRKQIEPLRKPYPKRPTDETVSCPANQPGIGGSTPTVGLISKAKLV